MLTPWIPAFRTYGYFIPHGRRNLQSTHMNRTLTLGPTSILKRGPTSSHQSAHFFALAGIAWDAAGKRLFVTGKWWPKLYQVQLKALKGAAAGGAAVEEARRRCIPRNTNIGWR